jgi:hypothetical protein
LKSWTMWNLSWTIKALGQYSFTHSMYALDISIATALIRLHRSLSNLSKNSERVSLFLPAPTHIRGGSLRSKAQGEVFMPLSVRDLIYAKTFTLSKL